MPFSNLDQQPNLSHLSPTTEHLNLSNLTGWEGGPCPRSTWKATHQQLNISISVISQVGKADPVPASSWKATHHQLNISISVISQVGKVDPVPASSLNATYQQLNISISVISYVGK